MPILGNTASAGKKPSTPTIGTASDGGTGTSASVAFTPSTYIGKSTITYTALSNPGSITATGAASPITVTGLTTGTAYTFTVKGDTNYGVASDYSAASNSVTPASPSSFESIATINITSNTAFATFSSIPQTYKSLQIRAITRASNANGGTFNSMIFNADSGANYSTHYLDGDGTYTSAGWSPASSNYIQTTYQGADASAQSNVFNGIIIDIHDYASTTKNKTVRTFSGYNDNGASIGHIDLMSGLWVNTSAITSIKLGFYGSHLLVAGSTFALYGVK